MKKVIVVSEKGGVGKTTIACHVAGGLAARGKRVLLVDFDHQANATLQFGLVSLPSVHDWLVRRRRDFASPCENLDIVPSDESTSFLPEILAREYQTPETILRVRLEAIAGDYDIVIIDTNPTIGDAMALVYNAADSAIITTTPSAWALAGLVSTWQHMQNAGVPLLGVAVTQYHRNWSVQKRLVKDLREHCETAGWRLFSPIYNSVAWQEAPVIQKLVWHVPFASPRPADQAWRLVSEVEEALGE